MVNKDGCHRDGTARDANMFGWIKSKIKTQGRVIFE